MPDPVAYPPIVSRAEWLAQRTQLLEREKELMIAKDAPNQIEGESHGLSVFLRLDDGVYHTYSVYARGVENLTDSYSLLDVTPYGREEDWEDTPVGWPQKRTYG